MVYLNNHSYYSFLYGTLGIEELLDHAARLGISSLALTDINTTSGVFDFIKYAHQAGIRPVVGVEFRNEDEFCYLCLAKNARGFAEINRFLSQYELAQKPFPLMAPSFEHVFTIYPLSAIERNAKLAPHEYIGVRPYEIPRLYSLKNRMQASKAVALQTVTFLNREGYELHRHLRAICHNCLLSRLPAQATAHETNWMVPPQRLLHKYQDYSFLLENAQKLFNQCSFEFDFNTSKNKKVFTTSAADDFQLLSKLAWEGFEYRYSRNDRLAQQRLEKELKVIHDLHYTAYFLITNDIIRYARSRGYVHVGRGSGANSIVAYCMQITDVDPIELDLYFERFINPARTSPPDFDIDFSWSERDEIIDYIFKRYGSEHVCLMAVYVTFQNRSQFRELGKVYGLPKAEIDALVEGVYQERRGLIISNPERDSYVHQILTLGAKMENLPRQLSIHAGGILISEEPLFHYTGLKPMPKGFPINHFDMYMAEEVGFAKFDILSQRGLGHIKESVQIIRKNRQVDVDIHRIQDFKTDPLIKQQLQRHETMGCFYIESPAMRQLIWKLRCDNYLTLVAASSIIRPGVASSGMMKEYIHRHENPASFQPIHPVMGELLAETYGVMVYQEDVIKVAHYFAGLTLAEADVLRRGMSGKYRSRKEFERIEAKFADNCREKGYPDEIWMEVWRQIKSFAGYSFSKAHSASFAVESYQSLFLKTHYPLEFITAVINNFGGFYSTEFYIHEARRCGAVIEAQDINQSEQFTRIEGNTLYLGWIHIKSLQEKTVQRILRERKEAGPFLHFDDFCQRLQPGLEQLILLIRIGAFREFGIPKKELLWQAHWKANARPISSTSATLFAIEEPKLSLPTLTYHVIEDAYDELELLGFTLGSPFGLLAQIPPIRTVLITVQDLPQYLGQVVSILGYLVNTKTSYTVKKEFMMFAYWLDTDGEFWDSVHFPRVASEQPITGRGVYLVEGTVTEEFGHYALIARSCVRLAFVGDPRVTG